MIMNRVAKALTRIIAVRLHTMPEPDDTGINPDDFPCDDD